MDLEGRNPIWRRVYDGVMSHRSAERHILAYEYQLPPPSTRYEPPPVIQALPPVGAPV